MIAALVQLTPAGSAPVRVLSHRSVDATLRYMYRYAREWRGQSV